MQGDAAADDASAGPAALATVYAEHGHDGEPATRGGGEGQAVAVLEPGATLGRYVLRRRLGRGGMGVVYEAHDPRADRSVAIKLLHGEGTATARERMRREAQALARLSSPHVVEIYEIGQVGGRIFIAMELVRGQTLAQWQARRPRPSWREHVRVYLQAGRGLAAVHAAGLVHRDFKPGNCMLGDDGRVRVLDLGVVKAIGEAEPWSVDPHASTASGTSMTRTGVVVGTPAYMPLEQLARAEVDARIDQYAFCVSLYEAVYGERPVPGNDLATLVYALERGEIRPPPAGSDVPASLRRTLLRGLSRAPEDRFPSMDALLVELERQVRPRRRGLVAVVMVGVLAPVAAWWAWPGATARDACPAASLAGVWDEAERERVRTAILATALAHAPETWERVGPALDRYAAAWGAERDAACMARLDPAGLPAMDRRIECLHEHRAALREVVEALAHVTPAQVQAAVRLVARLPAPSSCEGVHAFSAAPLPSDPASASEVEQLREQLAAARSLRLAGDHERAQAMLDEVRPRADALAHPPLQAEVALEQGVVHDIAGRYAEAARELEAAYLRAVEHGQAGLARTAAHRLARVLGLQLGRHEEGVRWGRAALVLARGAHAEPRDEALAHATLGAVLLARGEHDEALASYRRALALHQAARPPSELDVAELMTNIAIVLRQKGERDPAIEMLQAALPRLEASHGPRHPSVGEVLNNLGTMLLTRDPEQGVEHLRRALSIFEASLGSDHPNVAYPLANLGRERLRRGELEAALEDQRRALAIFEASFGPGHPNVATALTNVGDVLFAQGRLEEARDHHRRALAIVEEAFGPTHAAVAVPRVELARIALAQRDFPRAREHAEVAVAAVATGESLPEDLARPRLLLAQALWPDPAERARARALAQQAAAALEGREVADATLLAEIRAWLAEIDAAATPPP